MNIDGVIIPKDYKSKHSLIETEIQIKKIKDLFEKKLSEKLSLVRVSAPLFVEPDTGMNDKLRITSFRLLKRVAIKRFLLKSRLMIMSSMKMELK